MGKRRWRRRAVLAQAELERKLADIEEGVFDGLRSSLMATGVVA